MGQGLIKIESWYLVWSTVTDSPITFGMTLEELWKHIREADGARGLAGLNERIDRCDKTGTSFHGHTLRGVLRFNRAGQDETCLTMAQIVEWFCERKDAKRRPRGHEHHKDDRLARCEPIEGTWT